jgi:hypothetical protein
VWAARHAPRTPLPYANPAYAALIKVVPPGLRPRLRLRHRAELCRGLLPTGRRLRACDQGLIARRFASWSQPVGPSRRQPRPHDFCAKSNKS